MVKGHQRQRRTRQTRVGARRQSSYAEWWLLGISFAAVVTVGGVGATVFAFSSVRVLTGVVGVVQVTRPEQPLGAVAAYPFDAGGQTQLDVTPHGNHASCSGANCPSFGVGGYLTFDGRQQFLKVNDANDFSDLRQWAILGWFRPAPGGQLVASSGGGGGVSVFPLVTKGRGGIAERADVDISFFVGLTADYRLAADFEDRATSLNHPVTGARSVSLGEWHQFAAVFTGAALHVYVDGTLDGQAPVSALPATDSVLPVGVATSFNEQGVPAGFFAGDLDEVEIYRQALTADEVRYKYQTHYLAAYLPLDENLTQQADSGLYENAATCDGVSCPTWSEDGKVYAAFQFDGGGDYFTIADAPALNLTEYTLALWFKANAPAVRTQALLSRGEDWAKDKAQWVIELNDEKNPRKLQLWYESADDSDHYFPTVREIAAGLWYHVAVTRSAAGTVKVYLDGELQREATDPVPPAVVAAPVLIGARLNSPNAVQDYFAGLIDDVRIYRRVLAEDEVRYLTLLRSSGAPCQDGVDNDADGVIDLADPGCRLPTDTDEAAATTQCQDGRDNDGDGVLDLADPGCQLPTGNNEAAATTQCQDGADNDRDGLVDLGDPGCPSATGNDESAATTQCQDGRDNDGDGLVDLRDPGCSTASGDHEAAATSQCQDGADNDADGVIDLADPGCTLPTGNDESAATTQCQDGRDNDGDGLVDAVDPGCLLPTGNDEAAATAACQDGRDNDGDGWTDAEDPGCSEPQDGDESNPQTLNLINVGDSWRYFKGTQDPPSGWAGVGFDDALWRSGATGIGYGDGDDATALADMSGSYLTVYARKAFTLTRPDVYQQLTLAINYDDGFVAYLNGQEVARRGLGSAGTAVTRSTVAQDHEAGTPEVISLPAVSVNAGGNVLAVEIHNGSLGSSDLTLAPSLAASLVSCTPVDGDGDGVYAPLPASCTIAVAEADCRDDRAAIYPGNANAYCDCRAADGFGQGRAEICGNAVDEDCDGRTPACASASVPPRQGTMGGALNESSGMVASRHYPGVFWVNNDSGDTSRVFAVFDDGSVIREVAVDGASASDWEDIALDPATNELWVGDIGNNCNCRTDLKLWRFPEPNPFGAGKTARAERYDFQYPDGNHNAESLFIWAGKPYVVIKQGTANVYTFPQLTPGVPVTLTKVATFNAGGVLVTGADISADGRRLALVNHGFSSPGHHWVLERAPSSGSIGDFFTSPTRSWHFTFVNEQTEEVAFLPGTYSVVTGSEQRSLWRIDPWFYESK